MQRRKKSKSSFSKLENVYNFFILSHIAKMSATSLKSIVFILFAISLTSGEIVQNIVTKVADCFNCGMIEDVGQLDIKICGDLSCCFIQHMDNSEINFLAGKEDLFEGPASLLECYQYLVILSDIRVLFSLPCIFYRLVTQMVLAPWQSVCFTRAQTD